MAENMLHACRGRLRPRFVASHQWGVALPGGAEALVHWRSTMEELARDGTVGALVAFDLDLKNMFGSIEWPRIRAAVSAHFAEAARWTEWAHREAAVVQLPDGTEVSVDRGAEQGDPFGSTQASLALGDAMDCARVAYTNATAADRGQGLAGAVDEWFIDDGQAFVQPRFADSWLHAVDAALADIGAERGLGDKCKSVARLICPE